MCRRVGAHQSDTGLISKAGIAFLEKNGIINQDTQLIKLSASILKKRGYSHMDKLKVLLTGAAGTIGLETLKQLIEDGCDVTAFDVHNWKNARKLHKLLPREKVVFGDIRNFKQVEQIVKDKDIVIPLAAIIPPSADENPTLAHEVNLCGTINIVNAIKKHAKGAHLIFASSIAVYGDRINDPLIRKTDPLRASQSDHYAITKIRAERYIRNLGVNHTIFRLSAIMGRPQTDPLMFHMPLDTCVEIATVADTARALVAATHHTWDLMDETYNLGGGVSCRTSYRDFLTRMLKIYGLNPDHLKESSFATKNFHCGYYVDSDELESILHFRRDSLDDYYRQVEKGTNKIVRLATKLISRHIVDHLTEKSDPQKARDNHDEQKIAHYFA